jgi:hypothetical protein
VYRLVGNQGQRRKGFRIPRVLHAHSSQPRWYPEGLSLVLELNDMFHKVGPYQERVRDIHLTHTLRIF